MLPGNEFGHAYPRNRQARNQHDRLPLLDSVEYYHSWRPGLPLPCCFTPYFSEIKDTYFSELKDTN